MSTWHYGDLEDLEEEGRDPGGARKQTIRLMGQGCLILEPRERSVAFFPKSQGSPERNLSIEVTKDLI